MKYVAVIGSHTQLLSAVGTLELIENLVESDVLFIFIRNYKNTIVTLPWRHIDLNELYDLSQEVIRNKVKRTQLISEIDSLINTECKGSQFYAIVPHISVAFFQVLVTNRYCKGVKFIQEGAIIYKIRFEDTLTMDKIVFSLYNRLILRDKRCWRTHKWVIPRFLSKRLSFEAYALSDFFKYMKGIKNHFIIKWPKLKLDYELDCNNPCFIFDGYIEMKWVEAEYYYQVIENIIKEQGSDINYIKFHPAQTQNNRISIEKIFYKQNKKIILLPDSIPFELFLSKYNALKILGFSSSLLEFARQINNHTVVSYTDKLIQVSKMFAYRTKQEL